LYENVNFFQDSLLDVVVSLGAEDAKIILTGSAFGNRFILEDEERNMPGAAASAPTAITYQQVIIRICRRRQNTK